MLLAFVLAVVVSAHPDFWLASPEFDKKYCALAAYRVSAHQGGLNRLNEAMSLSPALATDPEVLRAAIHLGNELAAAEKALENSRSNKRLELLVGKTPVRDPEPPKLGNRPKR
jgi:hypothetical protein